MLPGLRVCSKPRARVSSRMLCARFLFGRGESETGTGTHARQPPYCDGGVERKRSELRTPK